jgi:hypothetical protein
VKNTDEEFAFDNSPESLLNGNEPKNLWTRRRIVEHDLEEFFIQNQ